MPGKLRSASGGRVSRRGFTSSAIGAGLVFSLGRVPAVHSKGAPSVYRDPAMDVLLDDARSELDQAKREADYHKIVDITLDECPLIYHCSTNNIQIMNKSLKGFVPTPQEYTEKLDTVEWA